MQQEAAHELMSAKRHGFVTRSSFGTVVLPAEGDAMLIHGEQTAVRDRHAVGIARQVGQHCGWTSKRTLGIDDPFALSQRREPAGKGVGIGERDMLAEELQAAAAMELVKLL